MITDVPRLYFTVAGDGTITVGVPTENGRTMHFRAPLAFRQGMQLNARLSEELASRPEARDADV